MAEQLPKVEFELDESKVLKLRFSEPKTGEGEYGTWWLYGADEWNPEQKVWKQVSWFTNERIVAILKDWKAKKGDEFLVFKKAGESKETGKVFTYFVITNKKTKETKSTKDMNTLPDDERWTPPTLGNRPALIEEPDPPDYPASFSERDIPTTRDSFEIMVGLVGDIREMLKRNDCEVPENFALTLLNVDGFWRCLNTLIMGQQKLNGR